MNTIKSVKLSAKLTLENKYIKACIDGDIDGDIDAIEYMIKKEGKTLKSEVFLYRCLESACKCENNENGLIMYKILYQYMCGVSSFNPIQFLYYACETGKFGIFKSRLLII